MAVEFKLPDIGEGVAEGEITKWLVKDGDPIREDQPMVEVMTDKATVEIPSPVTGRVGKILHPEGAVVPVHTAIVVLETEGGDAKAPAAAAPKPEAAAPPKPAPAPQRAPAPAAKAPAPAAKPAPAPAKPAAPAPKAPAAPSRAPAAEVAERATSQAQQPGPGERRGPAPIERGGGPSAANSGAPQPAPAKDRQAEAQADTGARVLAAPATRKLAREQGVDLASVAGSGPQGRVTKEDVQALVGGRGAPEPERRGGAPAGPRQGVEPSAAEMAPVAAGTRPEAPAPQPAREAAPAPKPAPAAAPARTFAAGAEERIPYRGIRKATGDQMVRSAFTAPHFTYVDEIDMTALWDLRKQAAELADKQGIKFTFLPLIVKALCSAIRRFPGVNAMLDEEKGEIVVKGDVHVGIATDTERGLMVPVIRNADRKSAMEIAGDIQRLSEAARTGGVKRDELIGSTITITSAGSIGGLFATPIINYPEVAILGVYQIKDKPVIRDGQIVPGKIGYLSLTLDHRVVDGATAAHFVNHMKRLLETPMLLAVEG